MLKQLIKGNEDIVWKMASYGWYLFLSLLAAGVLFGVLESTGFAELQFPNYVKEAKFGGAASVFLFTLIFLIVRHDNKPVALTIKGTVLDEKNNVLKGVKIRIEGDSRSAITDDNGFFTLDIDPNLTEWRLIAEYNGESEHKTVSKNEVNKPVRIQIKKKRGE